MNAHLFPNVGALAHRGPDELAVNLLQGLQLVGGEINAEGQNMAVVKNLRARAPDSDLSFDFPVP